MTTHGTASPSPTRSLSRQFPPARLAATIVALVVAVGVVAVVIASVRHPSSPARQPTVAPSPLRGTVGVLDTFARADSSGDLGKAESGQAWRSVQGTWGVQAGAARLVRGAALKRDLVVADMGASDGFVQVTQKVSAAGAGLVFRYRNEFNYWVVRAAPRFATWTVEKIVAGKAVPLGNLGATPANDGTTVSVSLQGSQIDLFVDGFRRRTISDADLERETFVGLSAFGEGVTAARWSNFLASAQREPLPSVSTTVTITSSPLVPQTPSTTK